MSGAKGGGGSGCLDIHCGEFEQVGRDPTLEVVASVLFSTVTSLSDELIDNDELEGLEAASDIFV